MKNNLENIFQTIKNSTNSLDQRNKLILILIVILYLVEKITSLLRFNIPGLNIMPLALLLAFVGFYFIRQSKHNKNENIKSNIYFTIGIVLTSFSGFIFSCIAIIYPFILLSAILL